MSKESMLELLKHAVRNEQLRPDYYAMFLMEQSPDDTQYAIELMIASLRRSGHMVEHALDYIEEVHKVSAN